MVQKKSGTRMRSAGEIRFQGALSPSISHWLLIKDDLVMLLGFLCGPDSHSESLCPEKFHQVLFFVGFYFTLMYAKCVCCRSSTHQFFPNALPACAHDLYGSAAGQEGSVCRTLPLFPFLLPSLFFCSPDL